MAMRWKKDFYKVKHPDKYLGDVNNVIYRSSWEQEAFKICDNNPFVLEWGSEIIKIPYVAPNSGGVLSQRTYIPDIYVVTQSANGEVNRKLIEIKPYKQTQPTRAKKPATRLYEQRTFAINKLKWAAAESWCSTRNIEFVITTERELFGNRLKR